ncbi:MAG: 4-alpha-glucanotransferase, partial [Candidatus Binatia bacterium]
MNQLYQLARLYNLQTAYTDGMGHRRQASPESILQVLRAMGVPARSMEDLSGAISQRYHTLWGRCIEPVIVAWEGQPVKLVLRLSRASAKNSISLKLNLETGEVREWTFRTSRLTNAIVSQGKVAGTVAKWVTLPGKLPWGYHWLTVEVAGKSHRSLVISAPVKAYSESPKQGEKKWGVFLPLYALRSNRSWGSGDFTDLLALATWVKGLGGGVVGTLPLLATFLDEPFDPSPYSPASRLFWNEFYLDVTRIPELESCPEARDLIASSDFQKEVETYRLTERVDYRSQMRLKRKVLEKLVRVFFKESLERKSAFDRFLQSHPVVEQYAQFRATCEKQRSPWPTWSQRLRDGHLEQGDYDEEVKQYHLYAQWLADQQLGALARGTSASGPGLYLDLPLGVHPHGYDVWSERDLFAPEVSVGAPPDSFFTGGQDWGIPPLQPETIREQGYRYPIAVIQHHLKYAGFLRIDHVMGLHRLFWIPKGMKPQHGVYVRYNAEESYAILSLESHRHQATLIGEN